ncbi:MAG: hypothetical protein HY001_04980 [Candidatus Portnoybacteria bacterium]|nr:hypothetical protein [Candidatus Portnoybacteria bacterium]
MLYTRFTHQVVLGYSKLIAVFFDIFTYGLWFQIYDIKKFSFQKEKPAFGLIEFPPAPTCASPKASARRGLRRAGKTACRARGRSAHGGKFPRKTAGEPAYLPVVALAKSGRASQ